MVTFLSPAARDERFVTKAGIALFLFVAMGLISYLISIIVTRKLSELSISMYPDRFERKSRREVEIFFWQDVTRADLLEYPNGEIATIKFTLANKRKVILFGLEDMQTAARQVEGALPAAAAMHRKRMKLNWDHPVFLILTVVVGLALFFAFQEIGERVFRFVSAILFFALGLSNLVFRPISAAQGKGWKPFETFYSILSLFGAVVILALELFRD